MEIANTVFLGFSIILCGLVGGMVLIFSIVIMPGVARFNDRQYLETFQVIDKVIQNNQPVFMAVWGGSALAVLVLAVISIVNYEGLTSVLSIAGAAVYLFGVQLPTVIVNIPINNRIQSHDMSEIADEEARELRDVFETRWLPWNSIRTVVAVIATSLFTTAALIN